MRMRGRQHTLDLLSEHLPASGAPVWTPTTATWQGEEEKDHHVSGESCSWVSVASAANPGALWTAWDHGGMSSEDKELVVQVGALCPVTQVEIFFERIIITIISLLLSSCVIIFIIMCNM